MSVAWFLVVRAGAGSRVGDDALAGVSELLARTPALSRGLVHTPATTHDPYLDDGSPPVLAIELHFDGLPALESALAPGAALQRLPDLLPEVRHDDASQQAMYVRRFPVPEPSQVPGSGGTRCTYLVSYDGPATDQMPGCGTTCTIIRR
ncbi:MAG: hypothetical protein R3E48_09705 [Burkholderiaceae bacterium]